MEKMHNFYDYTDVSIQIYNTVIKYWETARPNVRVDRYYEIPNNKIGLLRVFINSAFTKIARTNELINSLGSTLTRDEYEKRIDHYIDKLICFNNIQSLQEISNDEKRRQVKNCLAHSNFKIVEDESENLANKRFKIVIENHYIKGELSVLDIGDLQDFYVTLSDDIDINSKEYYGLSDLFHLKTNNAKVLSSVIDKIGWRYLMKAMPKNFTQVHFDTDSNQIYLNDEQKKLLEDYIKYIGINNWINADMETREYVFISQMKFLIDKKVDLRRNDGYISILLSCLLDNQNYKKLEKIKFEAPMAYASTIIDFGYFCFNYLREAHKKDALGDFNFIDFDLNGISVPYSEDDCFKQADYSSNIFNLLRTKTIQSEKLKKEIEKEELLKIGIKSTESISEDKKIQLLEIKDFKINQKSQELLQLLEEIESLNVSLQDQKQHIDSTNFFRHLRNSFSHGFYSIDYKKALANKNLEQIEYTFYDMVEKDGKHVKTFEVKLTSKRLVKLLNHYADRVKSNIDLSLTQNPDIVINIASRKKIPDYVQQYINRCEEEGKNIIRI